MPRIALVTGAAVRVGRAVALGLARDGFDVVVHHHRSESEAAETVAAVEAEGQRALALRADLSRPTGPHALIEQVRESFGQLDVLVNSASTYIPSRVDDGSTEVWDDTLAVNLRAPFLLVREAATMLRAVGGCVINMVDLSAIQPWLAYGVHSVSKAALLHLTKAQARTLAPLVRVNAIAPGNVLPPASESAEDTAASLERVPLGRVGHPDDVVGAVRFLVEARYVTGEVIVVDGGRLLEPSGP